MFKKNHFTKKLKQKTNHELEQIIKSEHHVDEAKRAAKWILEERGNQLDWEVQKDKTEIKKPWSLPRNPNPEQRKYAARRLVIFGISCLSFAIHLGINSLFVSRSSLVQLKGTISHSNVLVENVSYKNRFGLEKKSRKATLYFGLNEFNKVFKMVENIGLDYTHDEYNHLSRILKKSKKVSIWIRDSERDEIEPKVFQIEINDHVVLSYQSVRDEDSWLFVFLFFIGTGSIGLVLYQEFPIEFRRLFGMKESRRKS